MKMPLAYFNKTSNIFGIASGVGTVLATIAILIASRDK